MGFFLAIFIKVPVSWSSVVDLNILVEFIFVFISCYSTRTALLKVSLDGFLTRFFPFCGMWIFRAPTFPIIMLFTRWLAYLYPILLEIP